MVERPSQISGSGWDAFPDVWEWLRVPPRCLAVVGKPSWMFGICREALLDVREWSETLPNVREWWEALLDVREASQLSGSGQEGHPDVR